ncbi:hypothetical protein B0H13DRAFT_1450971, partial [Mycena leptocephala]
LPPLPDPPAIPDSVLPLQPGPKVSSPLPEEALPKEKDIVVRDADLGPDPDSHRGRARERELQKENLQALLNASSGAEFWKIVRGWTDPKKRAPQVTVTDLHDSFKARLNPPDVVPEHFDIDARILNELLSSSIPRSTPDRTPGKIFSRPFNIRDIENIKVRIKQKEAKSA